MAKLSSVIAFGLLKKRAKLKNGKPVLSAVELRQVCMPPEKFMFKIFLSGFIPTQSEFLTRFKFKQDHNCEHVFHMTVKTCIDSDKPLSAMDFSNWCVRWDGQGHIATYRHQIRSYRVMIWRSKHTKT